MKAEIISFNQTLTKKIEEFLIELSRIEISRMLYKQKVASSNLARTSHFCTVSLSVLLDKCRQCLSGIIASWTAILGQLGIKSVL